MTDQAPDSDTGTIVVLLERLRTQRLPRILDIKAKVDGGAKLEDYDLAFLSEAARDAESAKPLVDRHPELHEIAGRLVYLFREISDKALANEQGAHPDGTADRPSGGSAG